MALSFVKINLTVQNLARKQFDLNADTIKVALFTAATAVAATDDNYAATLDGGAAEVGSGNGYTTGGNSGGAGITSNSSGTETFRTTDAIPTWTASSSGFAFRYLYGYSDTSTGDKGLGFWDYGSTVTLSGSNGDTFTANGLNTSFFTLA
jgi:hypothetical protein